MTDDLIRMVDGEVKFLPDPSSTRFPGLTSYVRRLATRYDMPTRLLTIEEATTRLSDIPFDIKVNRKKAEEYFRRFVTSLKVFPEIPPILWLDGPHDYQTVLLDQGIFYREYDKFMNRLREWQNGIFSQRRNWYDPLPLAQRTINNLGPSSSMTSHAVSMNCMYCDHNYLRAIEAGLGYWIVAKSVIVLFPRPKLRFFNERHDRQVLHSTIAPAVEYPDHPASNEYYYRGTKVPAFVITNPERITLAHIRAARTSQVRTAMIDRYGLLRYIKERGYQPVDTDEENGVTLWVTGGRRYYASYGGRQISQRRCVLEMVNATPDPDGNRQRFARRVPGNVQTAREAVAWTFRMTPDQYRPDKQT